MVVVLGLVDTPRQPITTVPGVTLPEGTPRDAELSVVAEDAQGRPLPGVTFTAFYEHDNTYSWVGRRHSGREGSVHFAELPRGMVWLLAEKTGLRWASAALSPMTMFSACDPPVFPAAPWMRRARALGVGPYRLLFRIPRAIVRRWERPLRAFRAELGLPPTDALAQFEGHFGRKVVMSSGYRDPFYNGKVGGADGSYHTRCMAADFFIPGVPKSRLIAFAMRTGSVGGLGCYPGREFIHIDVRDRPRGWRKPVTFSGC